MARIGIKDYLKVEGLTKTFSSTSVKEKGFRGSLRVLDNVNFSCKAGQFITLVGSRFLFLTKIKHNSNLLKNYVPI
jgi:ABC-type glutathione transport system ATPase component